MNYYLYAKLDGFGNVTETFSKPQWYFNNGVLVDDKYLAEFENIYPVDTKVNDDVNLKFFTLVQNDISELKLDKASNTIINYYSYIKKEANEVFNLLNSEISSMRDSKIFSNVSYVFPNNIIGIIQIRYENDLSNIRALGFTAMLNPNAIFNFRDESNFIHKLNSNEILHMCNYIETRIQVIHSASQVHKSNLNSIKESLKDLIEYDFNLNWI